MQVSGKFSVYIVTNHNKTNLYTGVTNDLPQRLIEQWSNRGNRRSYAGRYYCFNLVYYEDFYYINNAIEREKEIKGWKRKKKNELIKSMNPDWHFLNVSICEEWPPSVIPTRF